MSRDVDVDVGSIAALNEAFAGPLYVFALRRLGSREAAEEVVQDTLVRAWRNAHRFDPDRGSVATWIFAIARNLVVDHHRHRAARPRIAAVDPQDVEPDDLSTSEVDRLLETWQMAEALHRLTPEHRAALVEIYYRGRTIREAAEQLDCPEGTVKSRLYYGLRSLRTHLEELGVIS